MEIAKLYITAGHVTSGTKTYDIKDLTCAQLRVHYGTGRAYTVSGNGRNKRCIYRVGRMTDIGDLLEKEWTTLAKYVIERDGEQEIFQRLMDYAKTCSYLHHEKEVEDYALQLHMSRMFENPQWVGYEKFQKENSHLLMQTV